MNRENIGDVYYEARGAILASGEHHMGCTEIWCISDASEAEDSVVGGLWRLCTMLPVLHAILVPWRPVVTPVPLSSREWGST